MGPGRVRDGRDRTTSRVARGSRHVVDQRTFAPTIPPAAAPATVPSGPPVTR